MTASAALDAPPSPSSVPDTGRCLSCGDGILTQTDVEQYCSSCGVVVESQQVVNQRPPPVYTASHGTSDGPREFASATEPHQRGTRRADSALPHRLQWVERRYGDNPRSPKFRHHVEVISIAQTAAGKLSL